MRRILPLALALCACKARPDAGASAADLFASRCGECHTRAELKDRTASDIRHAIDEIPPMAPLKGTLGDAELAKIEGLLGGKPEARQAEPAYHYQRADMCRPCHQRQVAQWKDSLHAKAHGEAVYDRYFIQASRETKQKIETFCAGCHTPIGVHRGEIPFQTAPKRPGDTTVSEVAAEGVKCDFCHTITGYDQIQNGGYRLTPVRVMRGPLRGASSPFHGTEYLPLFRSAELCGTCHNVSHPGCGIVLESTYTEWKESPYAREGVVCQDCHMTAGLTRRVVRPGRAAHGGPPRRHISDHFFVGPNVLFASNETEEGRELRRRSLELLRRAARLTIETPERSAERLVVPIRVANVGAGHGLPTGVTEIREMWLEVKVTASGKRLLHSGGLDARGDLGPEAIVYRTEVFDAKGKMTTRFWATARKGRDHRVPARGSVVERVEVPLQGVTGPVVVQASLRYRSVAPWGLDEVGARGVVDVPVITMATAQRTM